MLHKLNSAATLIQRTTGEALRDDMCYRGFNVHKRTISYCGLRGAPPHSFLDMTRNANVASEFQARSCRRCGCRACSLFLCDYPAQSQLLEQIDDSSQHRT